MDKSVNPCAAVPSPKDVLEWSLDDGILALTLSHKAANLVGPDSESLLPNYYLLKILLK